MCFVEAFQQAVGDAAEECSSLFAIISAQGAGGQDKPAVVIDLHRQLVRNVVGETDTLRRQESAIAFDWLVGDRERATGAAERLSASSPLFKKHWDEMTAGEK